MLLGQNLFEAQFFALCDERELVLQILVIFVLLVFAFLVDFEKSLKFQNAPGRAENIRRLALAESVDVDRGLIEPRRIHLRRDKPHPDQPVQLQLVFGEKFLERLGRTQSRSGADRFVRVLGVLFSFYKRWAHPADTPRHSAR